MQGMHSIAKNIFPGVVVKKKIPLQKQQDRGECEAAP